LIAENNGGESPVLFISCYKLLIL